MSSPQSTNRHAAQLLGFTLIELLVVMAVLGLLMAILLPGLGAARQLAQRTQCGANLRNTALAWHQYLDDHDGRFYQMLNANNAYGGWGGGSRPLNPYLGLCADCNSPEDAQVFCCPADRGGVPGSALTTKAFQIMGTSYLTNLFLIGPTSYRPFSNDTASLDLAISKRLAGLNRGDTDNPSRLLLMGDYGWSNQWDPGFPPAPPLMPYLGQAAWHDKAGLRKEISLDDVFPFKYNMAFLDGHVGFIKIYHSMYVADQYTVVPFADLYDLALETQDR